LEYATRRFCSSALSAEDKDDDEIAPEDCQLHRTVPLEVL
jgi:hypothetical protein